MISGKQDSDRKESPRRTNRGYDDEEEPSQSTAKVLLICLSVLAFAFILALGFEPEAEHSHLKTASTSGEKYAAAVMGKPHTKVDERYVQRFFDKQIVNHFSDKEDEYWSHRYFQSTEYFKGPGHPIFLIICGEEHIDYGMLYPFIHQTLAKKFGAAVVQTEHRFYGPYQPVKNATNQQLLELLTPHQALSDNVNLIRHLRHHEFGCSGDRNSKHYCPIVTVGGSYPGFLSAMFRLVYPEVIDISYASSAPLKIHAQTADQNAPYDVVTRAADRASPGCAAAVKKTLLDMVDAVMSAKDLDSAATTVGLCAGSVPSFIPNAEELQKALVQIVSFKFAEDSMSLYPPGPDSGMYETCQTFQQDKPSMEIMRDFLVTLDDPIKPCLDLMTQVPKGERTTFDDSDGEYDDGKNWDFQICNDYVFLLGFSKTSMFPEYHSTYEHLTDHCVNRFGIHPRPWELVEKWGFDDLSNASYILFTNGLQDMWSGVSYTENISDTVVAINFENGAHHSDLRNLPNPEKDTPDLLEGFQKIEATLEQWLKEIREQKE